MTLSLPKQFMKYFANDRQSVVKTLLLVTQGIIEARTANLNKIKDEMGKILENGKTQPESHYRRLTRFFNAGAKAGLIRPILCVCFRMLTGKIRYLTLDGTSWELGQKKIHLLTLCMVYRGVSIPIWWEELDKKGTSNFAERRRVIERASELLNLRGLILLADREYIGEEWFNYLADKGIGFVIRLKAGIYKKEVNLAAAQEAPGKKARYSKMQRKARARNRRWGLSKTIGIRGQEYTFLIAPNPKADAEEPLLYFLSTLKTNKQIMNAYPIRWTIESCFKHLKSNGFDLEAINMKNQRKICLMMALVVFAYVLCVQEGLLFYKRTQRKVFKTHKTPIGSKQYLAVSVFRKGLEFLKIKCYNLRTFLRYLKRSFSNMPSRKLLIVQ